MTEEETRAALWEIAQEVADTDTTAQYEHGGDQYCIFCSGREYYEEHRYQFKHEPSCIVLKARALVPQNAQQSH